MVFGREELARHWRRWRRSSAAPSGSAFPQHVIGHAIGMAGLIGVPAAVHMGQVESPDSAPRAPDREEVADGGGAPYLDAEDVRSEDHTSELPSLMRISYAVFCLNKQPPYYLMISQLD